MDPIQIIQALIASFASIPVVGKYIAIAMGFVIALSAVANSIVVVWHSLVIFMKGLASIPGLSGLQSLADSMVTSEKAIDDFVNGKLLPLLNQISSIPLPKEKNV